MISTKPTNIKSVKKCAIGRAKRLIGHENTVKNVNSQITKIARKWHENGTKIHENHENQKFHENSRKSRKQSELVKTVCCRSCCNKQKPYILLCKIFHFKDSEFLKVKLFFPSCPMAKTKKTCLAMTRTDLHAEPPKDPAPPPPNVRHVGKRPVEEKVAATEGSKMDMDPPCELCWQNLAKVKKFYDITYQEACELLSEVVGPDPKGASMRNAVKVKKEMPATSAATKKAKTVPDRKDVKSMPEPRPPMESQKPDDGSALAPEDGDDWEGEEEEDFEGDPIDEPDEVAVSATSKGNDDDQDSPAAGATVETADEVVGVPEAVDGEVEPTRTPVAVNPAVEAAKGMVPTSWTTTLPTPARSKSSRTIVQAERVDSSETGSSKPQMRSLLCLVFQ